MEKTRNRRDHILPAAYLRGFVSPDGDGRPWVYDKTKKQWSLRGINTISAERGFYDYWSDGAPDQTADEAFAPIERKFPTVRDDILNKGFSSWVGHKEFLLGFAQMMRARGQLFRRQHAEWAKKHRAPWNWEDRPDLVKNWAITDMRTEMKKGAAWFNDLDWALRFTEDPSDPVITSESPVLSEGQAPSLPSAVSDPGTLIFVTLCWQMCLVGSPSKFTKQTDRFHPNDLRRLRALFAKYADKFLVSPSRLRIEDAGLRVYIDG